MIETGRTTLAVETIRLKAPARPFRTVRVARELCEELDVFKARHRLASTEAAVHVVLSQVLGREDLLPRDLARDLS